MQATGLTCELARCNHYWLPASGELTTGFFPIIPPLELEILDSRPGNEGGVIASLGFSNPFMVCALAKFLPPPAGWLGPGNERGIIARGRGLL